MTLTPGSRLGPYEIQTPIGAGGMGEVYKARDTRLDRTVAIKILPESLAADPQFRERFDREARAISQLDHPHICALHDVGEQDGTAYLVMQYLDGDTLTERLAKGPLPLAEALRCAIQIADALDAAHRAGIVHRDLKPSNIKLTASGARLLDFGLAKAGAPVVAGAAATTAPTTPAALTQQGTILGTLQYMAPEQLEGQEADPRTDVFAFGAVLYEMVTERKAFEGRSQASLVGAILKDTPKPLAASQPLAPKALERVVMTCLEKDPQDRWQTVRDLRRELGWLLESPAESEPVAAHPHRPGTRLPWLVAAAALIALVGMGAWGLWRAGPPPAHTTRLSAALLPTAPYVGVVNPGRGLAVSPDGRQLVYGSTQSGRRHLYRRGLDQLSVQPIPGTEFAHQPFFSPDGRWVAFFTSTGELNKVELGGGPPVTLVRGLGLNGQWSFGAWRDDNTIVFSAFENLLQVSADAGTPTPLTTIDKEGGGDLWHHFPVLVPSTGDVVFTVYTSDATVRLDVLRWDTKTRSTLLENASGAVLTSSGHLLFSRDGVLMAAVFDPGRRAVGPASPVPETVVVDRFGISQLAVSGSGTLVYVAADPGAPVPTLGWVSRSGAFTELMSLPAGIDDADLSPDGTAAVVASFGTGRAFLVDFARQVTTPLSLGSRLVESARWHPDGRRVTLGGAFLSLLDPDSGAETRLTAIGRPKRFASWSPDGRSVAYMTFEPGNDIFVADVEADGSQPVGDPRPLFMTEGAKLNPAISPDGRWIAYRAVPDSSSPRAEVYLARYPDATGRLQVTRNGGGPPFWGPKSDELFFGAPPGVLQVARVAPGDRARVDAPRTLFPLRDLHVVSLSSDGSRFLAIREPATGPPDQIVVVQNWLGELSRMLPAR